MKGGYDLSRNFTMASDPVYRRFVRTCEEYGMLTDAKAVLVGLSGGADSSALLFMLREYSVLHPIKIKAIHINHMIRSDEAYRDELFCEEMCLRLGIDFSSRRIDVPLLSHENKTGLEETARNERYRIFSSVAKTEGFDKIAVAHNAQDNAETVIFNIARGSSASGAAGIAPVRKNIIRPLIKLTKGEITDFCGRHNIEYVIDSTNSDINYTRNFIRHEIFPKLKMLNPQAEQAFLRFSSSLCEDSESLFASARKYKDEDDVTVLYRLDRAVLKRALILKAQANGLALSSYQLEKTVELISRAMSQPHIYASVSLPSKKAFVISSQKLKLDDDLPACERIKKEPPLKLPLSAKDTRFFDYLVTVAPEMPEGGRDGDLVFCLPEAEIDGGLYVRNRLPGDAYVSSGMTRKIKKLICDTGIKREDRDFLPFICDEKGILAVYGLPLSDRVMKEKTGNREESLVFVRVRKEPEKTGRSGVLP